jgi:hypothetical protein
MSLALRLRHSSHPSYTSPATNLPHILAPGLPIKECGFLLDQTPCASRALYVNPATFDPQIKAIAE